MPIQAGDVTLQKSAVMADVFEGGGAPTGTVIPDGVSNAIFPDISELDRSGGRVNMRKAFVQVSTDDTDSYFGGNIIVAEPPKDPRVSVTLFSTGRTFDTRAQAQTRIEAYLNKGPEWGGFLYENHIAGQRVIQLFQRPQEQLPNVGQTLVIIENEGASNQREQYVRATKVTAIERTFTYRDDQDYKANVVTIELSDALRSDFTGTAANRQFTRHPAAAKIRDTVVADAGSYVGVVPLKKPAALGDFTVHTGSVYTQLVPSAQTETPISFVPPYAASGLPVPTAEDVSYTTSVGWSTTTNLNLPGGCLPGSLTITTGGITITDDGGILKTNAGEIGQIDYANGILTLASGSMNGSKDITYRPAAHILRAPQSSEIPVTPETRSQSYTGTIQPPPQPGTASISYMAQGRWYTLSDSGNGTLRGLDASYGAGTVSRDTGAFVVTLGALPDVGSSIVIVWNVPTQETRQPAAALKATQVIDLHPPTDKAIQPATVKVEWMDGTTKRTATGTTGGTLTGDGSGTLYAAQNRVEFAPNALPANGALLTVKYVAGNKHADNFDHPSREANGKRVSVTATQGSIAPGSLEVEWNTFTDEAALGVYTEEQIQAMGYSTEVDPTHIARDDGNGRLWLGGTSVGTVDYSTGTVIFNPDTEIIVPTPVYSPRTTGGGRWRLNYQGMSYTRLPTLYPNDERGYVKLRYNAGGTIDEQTETVNFAPSFRLLPGVNAQIVAGSVLLTGGGSQPWGDNGQGTLREWTGSGWLTRGQINYLTGECTLTSWTAGAANNFTRAGCVTTVGENISSEFVFRTGAAPLRPGSLSIQFARAGGGTQTVTAGADGILSATGVSGTVDYESGLVRVHFGEEVTAAGNENEPWYSEANVQDGKIFKPAPVATSTLRYSAVAYSYLPLNAELLGIDPVRLPSDGRVPIFRPGGFAVVGHTARIEAGNVSNGQTIDCARVRLSRVRVIGANGAVINTGYNADLEAGKVTFTDVTGYSQPVVIEHRIEDMAVVRDVQISGEVSFTRPLTHDYPADSFVSSALIAGDLFARVSVLFDQYSWNNVWADAPIGDVATGTFNAAQFPIVVTNRGAVTERWCLRFTQASAYEVIGENVGVIATGNTAEDCAPPNPAAGGAPYFRLPALGWGQGWAAGNVLRFNTVGAQFPVWVVRTIQQGPETVDEDSFTLLVRGDVDKPSSDGR